MKDTDPQAVLARLLRAAGVSSEGALSGPLGVSTQAVYDARRRGKIPDAWIRTVAEKCEVSADWLFFGRGPMRPGAAGGPALLSRAAATADGELLLVPMVEARLSAGAGSLETGGEVEKSYAFRADFLRRKGNPDAMVLMRVAGDSMMPEICHGDVVLLDQAKKDILPGHIFAVGFEESIYLKRIDTLPGKVILRSANPAYPPVELDARGDLANTFRVIGRVLWAGREYK